MHKDFLDTYDVTYSQSMALYEKVNEGQENQTQFDGASFVYENGEFRQTVPEQPIQVLVFVSTRPRH